MSEDRSRRRIYVNDLPEVITAEEIRAQLAYCDAQVADIRAAQARKSVSDFPSKEAMAAWLERSGAAMAAWSNRCAELRMKLETARTRATIIPALREEIEQLRKGVNPEHLAVRREEIARMQSKLRRFRGALERERCLVLAVLRGDAPDEQREALRVAVENRLRPESYTSWLERARRSAWRRSGPLGKFSGAARDGEK